MANQDWSVDFVDRPKAQVSKDRAYTLTCKVYENGTQSVPSAGTITILGPGGGALPGSAVTGAAVTVDGAGTMTYALSAANAASPGANYSAVWNPTIDSVVLEFFQLFDVVRYPLINVVQQADLVKHHADLTDVLFSGESNYQDYIEQAFQDVYQVLENHGKRPYLVMDNDSLRRPIEHKALALIFRARFKEENDRWWNYWQIHETEYNDWMQAANFVYDWTESGTADGTSNYDSLSGEEGHNVGPKYRI